MALAQTFVLADQKSHDLKGFDCNKPAMNLFLSRFAIKNGKLGLSRTWVLPVSGTHKSKAPIAAYYTLAFSSVSRNDVPIEKNLPGYPVPMVLLARLAVDIKYQGQHLGEKTLITSLRKSVDLTDKGLPAVGLILDVLDEEALHFYQRYEIFKPFTNNPMRLFVPMQILRQL